MSQTVAIITPAWNAQDTIVTTVHSSQVVEPSRVPLEAHDAALHAIATEAGLILTGIADRDPSGVMWSHVKPDQFANIPFLTELRRRMEP